MVGDSIFPGQSVPAVSLGGLRVAHTLLSKTTHRSAFDEADILDLAPEFEQE
jgi:hypothetical protein